MNSCLMYFTYRQSEGVITDRSHNPRADDYLLLQGHNKKNILTSTKKPRTGIENSNSQKRRVSEQARLMKIKNFPPDFFKSSFKDLPRSHKQSYSVDRGESRRQRRMIHNHSKGNLNSISRVSNKKSKRVMSEGRHQKRMVVRELSQKQVPAFFLRNELQCIQ